MSFSTKVVIEEINFLKNHLKNLYEDSQELNIKLLEKLQSKNKPNKRSWEYATYKYLRSALYERKNKYKKLYKAMCEVENFINKKQNKA